MRTRKDIRYEKQKEQELERIISRFSQHLMSNSKWVKLIDSLIENIDKIKKVEFKKVQGDQIGELYLSADTTFGFDYWENGFEGHNSLGGCLAFKEIEYLISPKVANAAFNITQDLALIEAVINSVGQFELKISEEQLKLICHRS